MTLPGITPKADRCDFIKIKYFYKARKSKQQGEFIYNV